MEINNDQNNISYYQIQLYGANPNSQSSKAKISLNKIEHINPHK